jgi:DNA-binding IclR family transcriptional regulator
MTPGAGDKEQRDRNGGIQVIARAGAILRALSGHPQGVSLSSLAKQVELPRSTTHRIVSALQAEDFVIGGSDGGRVRLGPGLVRLAAAERLDLRAEVRPHIEDLSARLAETVDLAVLDGDAVLFLDQVSAPQRLRAVSAVGSHFPAYCTANGKALLAELPLRSVQDLLPARLEERTPNTLTSRSALEKELGKVRRDGYAVDREEHTLGICAVGAVVHDSFGAEMALTVPLPAQRFVGREDEIAQALMQTCAAVERDLGYSAD